MWIRLRMPVRDHERWNAAIAATKVNVVNVFFSFPQCSDTRHKQPESSSREMLRRTFSGCSLPEDDDV